MPHFDNFAPAEEEKPTEESAQPKAEEENTETVAPIPTIGENIKAEPVEPTPMEEAPAEEDLNESPAPMQEEITDDSENISDYGGGILGSAVAAHGYRQEAVPNNEVVPNASALHRAPEKSYDEPKRSVQSAEGISAEDEPNENFKNISEEVPAHEKEVEQPPVFKQATVPAPIASAAQPKAEEPAAEQQSAPQPAAVPAPQPAAAEKPARTESAKPNSFAAPRTEQKAPVQAAPSKPYYNEIALDKRKDLENYSEPEKKQPAHMPLETDVIATKPREYKDKKGFGIVAIIFAILLPPLGIVLGIVAISRGWTTMNKTYSRLGTAAIIIGVIATIAFSFALIKWIIPAITELINNKRNSMFLFM